MPQKDDLPLDARDQIAAEPTEGQIETMPLETRPFWQLALVVGNSVEPRGPSRARDQQIQTLLTNFLISAPALGPAVGQVATCRGRGTNHSSAARREMSRQPGPGTSTPPLSSDPPADL